jgi:hypothetical protein
VSKRSGFYPCPAVDTAGSNVVSQAGGLLLTETIRAVGHCWPRRSPPCGPEPLPAEHHNPLRSDDPPARPVEPAPNRATSVALSPLIAWTPTGSCRRIVSAQLGIPRRAAHWLISSARDCRSCSGRSCNCRPSKLISTGTQDANPAGL